MDRWTDFFPRELLYLIMVFNQDYESMNIVFQELDLIMNDVVFINTWFEDPDDIVYESTMI